MIGAFHDFGFEGDKGLKSQYYMEIDIPLADIPEEMLRVLVGDDYWQNMYRQEVCDQRWEDDGGAYL